ncbi:TlpA family protein disulfide reductase [Granulicella sp. WH15]|uniref:TlpA family protein disulfide reductase n=1 Tax=Granulicella sp. WH15 TaxID=2602070 RepID=UPI0013676214|nr:TlpA disulfide reductase family protein [Granulicella sp. WH15]QHN02205.1 TlpA family protein disulfide reductase [Granulicella sp. WH15]
MAGISSLRVAVVLIAAMSAGVSQAQTTFSGRLNAGLHVDPDGMGVTVFDPVASDDTTLLGVMAGAGDKVFTGVLAFPKGGSLQYKALIVRSPNGTDVLYVDADRDGRFGDAERITFHALKPAGFLKDAAEFEVSLPDGPFKSCPMQVGLVPDGVPTPPGLAKPGQLAVLYTSLAFVEGYAQLPRRKMLVRLSYNFDKREIDLSSAMEWMDVNADGRLDLTARSPEMLRARGSAPVFSTEGLLLQVQSVDLERKSFILRTASATKDRRFQLVVGTTLPDFEFTDFAGVKRHFSDVKGRYRLIDFWATWCRPCVEDLPYQKRAYEAFHARGFEILGMNGDESFEKAAKMLQRQGIGWEQARMDNDLYGSRFQIVQWPTMILIDERGKIVSVGAAQHLSLDGEHLFSTLESLMNGR